MAYSGPSGLLGRVSVVGLGATPNVASPLARGVLRAGMPLSSGQQPLGSGQQPLGSGQSGHQGQHLQQQMHGSMQRLPGKDHPQAMSETNTTVGAASDLGSRAQLGFERRLAWLEEDVTVLHRRLRDECGEGGPGTALGDQGLRALVMRLDAELSSERRARENLEGKVACFQDALLKQRKEVEAQIRHSTVQMESMMGNLFEKIDKGLSTGAANLRHSTEETELRLRNLMSTLDESGEYASSPGGAASGAAPGRRSPLTASAGAAARLGSPRRQGQSAGTPLTAQQQQQQQRAGGQQRPQQSPATVDAANSANDLQQSYDRLRQENAWLREQRARIQGATATPGAGATPSATPSLAYPSTLQVPGTGLSQPAAGGRPTGIASPVTVGATVMQRMPGASAGPAAVVYRRA